MKQVHENKILKTRYMLSERITGKPNSPSKFMFVLTVNALCL